jgi:hypothetical protein
MTVVIFADQAAAPPCHPMRTMQGAPSSARPRRDIDICDASRRTDRTYQVTFLPLVLLLLMIRLGRREIFTPDKRVLFVV